MTQATTTPDLHQELAQIKTMLTALLHTQRPLMSGEEVCRLLGISRNTLTTYKKRPGFPTPTRGKFDRAEIIEWATQKPKRSNT